MTLATLPPRLPAIGDLTPETESAMLLEPAKVTPAQPNHSAVRARIFRALAGSTKTRRRRVD
jgi:hypothetical protein